MGEGHKRKGIRKAMGGGMGEWGEEEPRLLIGLKGK